MKKKLLSAMLLGCALMIPFTGCQKKTSDTEQTEESEQTEETEETEEQELTYSLRSPMEDLEAEENIVQLVDNFVFWSGMGNTEDLEGIDTELAVAMAIYHCERYEEFGTEGMNDSGNYIIHEKMFQQSMIDLFGKEYDTEGYSKPEGIYTYEEDEISFGPGDWGMSIPQFEARSCEEQDGKYIVSGNCVWFDYEDNSYGEPYRNVEFTIEKNADSLYGYVITDIQSFYIGYSIDSYGAFSLRAESKLGDGNVHIENMLYAFANVVAIRNNVTGSVGTLNGLTDDFAVSLAAFHCEMYNEYSDLRYQDDCKVLTEAMMSQSMKDLYGKQYSLEAFKSSTNKEYGLKTVDNQILMEIGEWGLDDPEFRVTSMSESGNEINVTGYVVMVMDGNDDRVLADVEVTFARSTESLYGIVITNIVIK